MSADRVHRLAQAAQVGDLLAERCDQLLEVVEPMVEQQLALVQGFNDAALVAMVRNLEQRISNLRRAADAYSSVR